ncbi:MAG: hypothetical protein J0M12_00760 [Deltaproteobacteria bacterium]|nr:hypothetical protein [Deltaproteobacteria bacterium]
MSLEELLRHAQQALDAIGTPGDEFLEKIAAYSAAFEAWASKNSEVLSGTRKPENEDTFRTLAAAHAKLMEHAEALKRKTGKDLSDLRKKGKGIMAYTDILPKRISISGTKKG